MKKLQEMKATELKEMAKGLQVKNWWLLKKEQLITEIEKAQQTTIEEINCIQCNSVLEGDENICPICGTDQEAPHLTALEATLMEEIPQPEATQEEPAIKPAEEDLVTLKELIAEAGIKGTKARRLLRNADIERPYKRWEWHTEDHKHIINQVKNLLK